ncbi:MAG: ABC transporter ATP-binding protein [Micavibrio sp.]|nr:MAG: ABC transporter ATP-binding protein [Micavibrio sp.]
MSKTVLSLKNITRQFEQGGRKLDILAGADLEIREGESVALVAPSGAGKSTLLQIAGLLDQPSSGEVYMDGALVQGADDETRTRLRREKIGFIYQFHYLLSDFNARENLVLPQLIAGKSKKQAQQNADELLKMVKLSERAGHYPSEMSGGEQQRVAIARALVNNPVLLLADEPTGNLDPRTAGDIFTLLKQMVAELGLAALIVTHNMELARQTDRILTLKDGKIVPYDKAALEDAA